MEHRSASSSISDIDCGVGGNLSVRLVMYIDLTFLLISTQRIFSIFEYMIRKINRDKWAITAIAGSIHLH